MTADGRPGAVRSPEDGRLVRGRATRSQILGSAAAISTIEGLGGLSIGRLATDLGLSKAGVLAHFGTKEQLQLATIADAMGTFTRHVIEPVTEHAPGLPRAWGLASAWLHYAETQVFPGGCFFLSASVEFGARPGAVREALAAARQGWLDVQAEQLRDAQRLGQLDPGLDVEQLAFEIDALAVAADLHSQLCGDSRAYDFARHAIHDRLAQHSLDPTQLPAI